MTPALQDAQADPADVSGPPAFGWVRATTVTAVIVAISGTVLLYVPDLLLTELTGMTRSGRVALVTTVFFVLVIAVAWALRRLQARRLI